MKPSWKFSNRLRPFGGLVAALFLSACQVLTAGEDLEKSILAEQKQAEELARAKENDGPKVSLEDTRSKDPTAQIGAKAHPKIVAQNGGVYQNQSLENLLAVITGRLVAESGDNAIAYDITVLNTPKVNAFALPGGYLYITRGLLALANDASEVAAVLAHEMAHVSSNHGLKRSRQTKAVEIASRVAGDVLSNPTAGRVAEAATKQRLAKFSQRQELQADAVGIKLLGRAGYDAFGAPRFLQGMERYSAWRSSLSVDQDALSSTHPSTPQRVEIAKRHARAVGAPGSGERNRDRFLKGIDGILFGDPVSQGAIRGQKFAHAKLGFSFEVPPRFDLSNRESAVLAAGPNEMALRFDAVPQKNLAKDAAAYLKSGWVNGLEAESVTATTVNGLNAATGKAIAGDWQFAVSVVSFGERYYRFILAAPRSNVDIAPIGRSVVSSFRALTASEKKALKPLRIKLVTVKASDTVAKLAGRMKGVSRKVDLFKAMNGLGSGDRLKTGMKVKIVTDS